MVYDANANCHAKWCLGKRPVCGIYVENFNGAYILPPKNLYFNSPYVLPYFTSLKKFFVTSPLHDSFHRRVIRDL